jgi:Predicted membrane protein
MENELHKEMYTLNDLLEQLRIKNVTNISDVEYAILETNGQLSVLPKSQKRPLNPEDMSLTTKYEGLALDMIVDGRIIKNNLEKANLDENWLKTELAKLGIQRIEDVFFASLDTDGNLYYQEKIKQRKLK